MSEGAFQRQGRGGGLFTCEHGCGRAGLLLALTSDCHLLGLYHLPAVPSLLAESTECVAAEVGLLGQGLRATGPGRAEEGVDSWTQLLSGPLGGVVGAMVLQIPY